MNFNDNVRVRLTPYAREIERRNHSELVKRGFDLPFVPKATDADGWSTWHLWELMQAFGTHCYMGGPQLFVDNELVLVKP